MKGKTVGEWGRRETLQDVLELARSAGFEVTERQLKRWRDEGLVSSPRRIGLGRGRGTEALYPPGTGDLVIAIARELENYRNLEAAGLKLWFQGWPLTEYTRNFFVSIVRSHEKTAKGLLRASLSGQTDEPVASWIDRDRLPAYGWLRKAVGRERFDVPVFLSLRIMADQLDEENLQIQLAFFKEVRDSLNTTLRKTADRFEMPEQEEFSPDEMMEILGGLDELLGFGAIRARAEAMSPEEWEALRNRALEVVDRWRLDTEEREAHALAFLTNLVAFPPEATPPEEIVDRFLNAGDPRARQIGQKMQDTLLTLEV